MRRAGPDRRARRLVRWYPKEWRRRYGEEFTQLLVDDIDERPRSWQRTLDVARGGLAAQMAQRQLTGLRFAAAGLILGAALAGAAVLHAVVDPHRQIVCPHGRNPQAECLIVPGHGWVNPVALGIASLGVATALGLLLAGVLRPFQCRVAGAVAIVGIGAALVVWVATHREVVPSDYYDQGEPSIIVHRSLAWTAADGGLIGIAALGLALAVLQRKWPLGRLWLAGVVLVLGLALAGAALPHVVSDPGGFRFQACAVRAPSLEACIHVLRPRVLDAAALALCALAAAGAVGVLVTARRRRA
jgi:hypothetical protein